MKTNYRSLLGYLAAAILVAFAFYITVRPTSPTNTAMATPVVNTTAKQDLDNDTARQAIDAEATFAMGCFWHSEEMFSEIRGVRKAVPGYSGGTEADPSYDLVSTGTTGHAESVDVTYDPAKISYAKLLQVFFAEHDPTTPNYSAPDEGPQYRSVIFYRNAEQKKEAEDYIAKLTAEHKYKAPIVTQVVPFQKFYRAEDYHIHYVRNHPDQPYVAHVTKPEIAKFQKDFPDLVKR